MLDPETCDREVTLRILCIRS